MGRLLHKELSGKILEIFYEVYNELGAGFLESVYENALMIAFQEKGIRAENQKPISVYFRDHLVGDFRADIIVEDIIILELKAVKELADIHTAQLLNYLRATNIELGFLLNFGQKPEFKRYVMLNSNKQRIISDNLKFRETNKD